MWTLPANIARVLKEFQKFHLPLKLTHWGEAANL